MAGHKEIETTYRVYYQILEKQKNDAIDELNEKTYKKFT
jgi:integrase